MFLRQLAAASAEVQPPARWALPDTEETAGHRPRSDSQRRQARTQGPSPSGTPSAGPAVGALLRAMPRRGCSAQRFRGSGSPAPSPCSRSLRGHGLCRVTPAEGTGGDSPRGFIPERGAPPCARCRECRKGVRDRAAAVCSVGCCSWFTARGKKFPPQPPATAPRKSFVCAQGIAQGLVHGCAANRLVKRSPGTSFLLRRILPLEPQGKRAGSESLFSWQLHH